MPVLPYSGPTIYESLNAWPCVKTLFKKHSFSCSNHHYTIFFCNTTFTLLIFLERNIQAMCKSHSNCSKNIMTVSRTLWLFQELMTVSRTLWLFQEYYDCSKNIMTVSRTYDCFKNIMTVSRTLWLFQEHYDCFKLYFRNRIYFHINF